MFLKNVKSKLMRKRSITARLTIFYTLATLLLLSVATLFLYVGMLTILRTSDEHFLVDEIDSLKKMLQKGDYLALQEEIQETPFALNESFYHYYIQVIDVDKKNVLQTMGMQKMFAHAALFKEVPKKDKENAWWRSVNGSRYLLMQSLVQFSEPKKTWIIRVALDISYQDKVVSEYRNKMILVLLIATCAALLLGYFIARRGMRSLYDLTESTKKITVSSLHQRINPEYWPSELHTLGMAFNQMLDRIEISFAKLTQFSADLAHELRTPINNLLGEIEIALSRNAAVEDYRLVLESNLEEAQRLSHIIENLLFLARAENPHIDLKKTALQVEEEIAVVIEYYQAMADEKNIQVVCKGSASLRANLIMFRRLMNNLLSNALKYTAVGGSIVISIEELNAYSIQIKVQDTGVGIGAEHLPQIFNRFYRVDASRTQHSGGIGLGLAIAKSIVDLHQGIIFMTSVPGQGTAVTIQMTKL